ncbi:1191_t:CDS:1, partial [Racocetra persica]
GLENLTNLTILNCTDNEIAELNVSKNTKLEVLRVHDNQNIKLIGLENLPNLEMFSCSQNPLAIIEIVKE